MLARTSLSSLSLSLLACSLVGCTPKAPEDSGTETDAATDSASGDTTGGATEGVTGGVTDGSSSGDTTGGDACPAVDPAVKSQVSINFNDWPKVPDAYPERIEVAADCKVTSASADGGLVDVSLACTEGNLVDLPISLSVVGPADFSVALAVDATVKLAAFWEGDAVDYVGGQWFVLRDDADAVLLAGLVYHGGGAASDALAPLSATPASGVCEPTCENGCTTPEWDMVERLGVTFAHTDGPSVQVLDGQRAQLVAGGDTFDLVVGQAKFYSCLNCGDNFAWALRRVVP